jgi:outer membrane immunogenic protein
VEGALAGNWTAKFEDLHVELGDLPLGLTTNIAALGGGALVSDSSSRTADNIGRPGVNYRFGGQVAARC